MPVSLNVLDGAIKIVNCTNSQPLSMTCAEMDRMHQVLLKYIQNRSGCYKKNHLCDWAVSWTSHVFMEHYFYMKEWQTSWLGRLAKWLTFSQKWTCQVGKNEIFLTNEEIRIFRWKLEFWKTCIHHHELYNFQVAEHSWYISGSINECDVLILHNKMYQRLEDVHNWVNSYFSYNQCM